MLVNQPEAAASYQHVCPDEGCIYLGQPSFRGCGCHKTREQMMLARIQELTKALKATREQLIKVRDASPEIRNHELETNQVIAQAWHTLNDTGVATPLERSGGAT